MIRERVTQGDPLWMVLYRIALLPLYEAIWEEESGVLQTWYDKDGDMLGPAELSDSILNAFTENIITWVLSRAEEYLACL